MSRADIQRVSGRMMRVAVLLVVGSPALAAHPPAPTVSIDPAAHVVAITGPHHPYKPVLNLIRTDWWLHAAVEGGVPGDPELMFAVDLPGWAGLDSASDASGAKLAVAVLARGPSPDLRGENAERVAITLPRVLAAKAETTGLTVTVAGKLRTFAIVVPGPEIGAFLAAYDAAIATAMHVPRSPAPAEDGAATKAPERSGLLPAQAQAPAALVSPLPSPPPVAAATQAAPDASAAGASDEYPVVTLGIVIEPSVYGAMLLSVSHDSRLAKLGVAEGDFIAGVDGKSIKGLSGEEMAARIGAPGVRVLNCIADGDVSIR
jgi:hypothetical protein